MRSLLFLLQPNRFLGSRAWIVGIPASVLEVRLRRAAQREAFLGLGIYHRPKLGARRSLISPNPPSLLHLLPAPLIISDAGFA